MKDNKTKLQNNTGRQPAEQKARRTPGKPVPAADEGKEPRVFMIIDRTKGANGLRVLGRPERSDMAYPVQVLDGRTVADLLKAGIGVLMMDAVNLIPDHENPKTDGKNTGMRDKIRMLINQTTGTRGVYREPTETDMAYPVDGLTGWTVGDLIEMGIEVTFADDGE